MSGRSFDFTDSVKKKVAIRQNGVCAICGQDLAKTMKQQLDYCNCHHVIPDQAGSPGNTDHQFLKTDVNGVYLCHECHVEYGHAGGKYKNGAVSHFGTYKYSHGNPPGSQAQAQWMAQLRDLAPKVWSKYKVSRLDYP